MLESAFLLAVFSASLRASAVAVAWQSITSKLESTFCLGVCCIGVLWVEKLESTFLFMITKEAALCHALRSKARNDKKWACFVESTFLLFCAVFSKVDSRVCVFVCVDCHATAGAVSRNDRK